MLDCFSGLSSSWLGSSWLRCSWILRCGMYCCSSFGTCVTLGQLFITTIDESQGIETLELKGRCYLFE
jgi:hypothetical protein